MNDILDTYRIWNPATRSFRYVEDLTDLIDWDASQKATDAGNGCVEVVWYDLEGCTVQPDTTLRAADGSTLWEGDIISFTIRGHTHGPEPDECRAAHIWWCAEDGCWAFGCWEGQRIRGDTFRWWYSMQDDIIPGSIKLLGNVLENPELLPLLGYDPFATPTTS